MLLFFGGKKACSGARIGEDYLLCYFKGTKLAERGSGKIQPLGCQSHNPYLLPFLLDK